MHLPPKLKARVTLPSRLVPTCWCPLRAGAAHLLQASAWSLHGNATLSHLHSLMYLACYSGASRSEDSALAYAQLINAAREKRGVYGWCAGMMGRFDVWRSDGRLEGDCCGKGCWPMRLINAAREKRGVCGWSERMMPGSLLQPERVWKTEGLASEAVTS